MPRFSPSRTLRPTREGWWCLLAAVGVGFAAVSTGNNLLYLLEAMLLGLVVVSGLLSEMSMRGIHLALRVPDEVFAGRPALFAVLVVNTKRRLPSYSIALSAPGRGEIVRYVPRLRAREERLIAWETTFPSRGHERLPALRVTTRFPFGLFAKSGPVAVDAEIVVYPALRALPAELQRRTQGTVFGSPRRAGRGHGLRNLREYRAGDDPRLIHWRLTAKRRALIVRELEEETTLDARLVLTGRGEHEAEQREQALSEAAGLARALLRAGAGVALVGPAIDVPMGRGREHERRILTALALYDPLVLVPTTLQSPGPRIEGRDVRFHLGW
ncbi:MAG TPA: DUF58 domain-containing protein [Candidatus Acidoferrum sp.]|nr:DUF58 domain-containing protein [Candidatus Acidoferrum sp.]